MDTVYAILHNNLPFLLVGAQMTVVISLLGALIGIVLGLLIALARLSPHRLVSTPAGFYVDIFRSVPFIVQLVWAFYAIPIFTGFFLTSLQSGVIALGFYSAGFFAEIFRAGILAVPAGEGEAALAQGMTWAQSQRRVVLPIAIRKILPPTVNTLVVVIKDSSVVSVLGVGELMFRGGSLAAFIFRPLEVLTVVAIIYVLLTFPVTLAGEFLQRRVVEVR